MSDFKAKMHQNPISAKPPVGGGSLQRFPDLLAGFKETTFREGEGVLWIPKIP